MDQKVKNALDLLQRAQDIVNEAAQELCSVPGYSDEWTRMCRLYDRIKADWHRVDRARIARDAREHRKQKTPPGPPTPARVSPEVMCWLASMDAMRAGAQSAGIDLEGGAA